MNALSLRCIKAAFMFLALGITLGVTFAINRALGASLRPLHSELNLWGWTTLLIYGFGYHMLPRFAGRPLSHPRLANIQSFLAIGGVIVAALGWLASAAHLPFAVLLCVTGASIQLIAAALFVWQMYWVLGR